jgi:hypothetical protein
VDPYPEPDESISQPQTIFISFSYLQPYHRNTLFSSSVPTKTFEVFPISLMGAVCRAALKAMFGPGHV